MGGGMIALQFSIAVMIGTLAVLAGMVRIGASPASRCGRLCVRRLRPLGVRCGRRPGAWAGFRGSDWGGPGNGWRAGTLWLARRMGGAPGARIRPV
jgi:hypothetical protein